MPDRLNRDLDLTVSFDLIHCRLHPRDRNQLTVRRATRPNPHRFPRSRARDFRDRPPSTPNARLATEEIAGHQPRLATLRKRATPVKHPDATATRRRWSSRTRSARNGAAPRAATQTTVVPTQGTSWTLVGTWTGTESPAFRGVRPTRGESAPRQNPRAVRYE
jgi:hypothetical protein